MKITRATAGIAAVAAALALASCSTAAQAPAAQPSSETDPFTALVEAAKAEGSLTFYGDGLESSIQAWSQGFTEEYGITVNILRMTGNEINQRFAQEMSAGQYQADILSITNRIAMENAVEQGWIAQYTPEDGDLFPSEQVEEGYFYPVQNGFFNVAAYNPTLLSEDEIELIRKDPIAAAGNPAFAGRVAVGAPHASQQGTAFWYNLSDGPAADEYGWDALEDIAANKPQIQVQTLTLLQNLVAGEYPLALLISDTTTASQVIQGAPVEFVYPATIGGYFATGVVEHAPHPNAARLFMEWATTPEANERYIGITQSVPTNSEATDDRKILGFDWYEAPDMDDVWVDFIRDEKFLKAASADGDYLDHWSEVFGYTAG